MTIMHFETKKYGFKDENPKSVQFHHLNPTHQNSRGIQPVIISVPEAYTKHLEHVERSQDLLDQKNRDRVNRNLDIIISIQGSPHLGLLLRDASRVAVELNQADIFIHPLTFNKLHILVTPNIFSFLYVKIPDCIHILEIKILNYVLLLNIVLFDEKVKQN